MKTNNPQSDDPQLDSLLREWNPKPPLPPRFQEQVWRRIERAESTTEPDVTLVQLLTNWLATWLPRPAPAVAYVAVLLLLGAAVGWSQARHETARVNGWLSARYVQTVDPYQPMP